MKQALFVISVGTLAVLAAGCTSASRRPSVEPAPGDVVVVTEQRYVHDCQFLTCLPFRDSPLVEGQGVSQGDSREVTRAGGNVLYLPSDKANLGRYAAYRCTDDQLRAMPFRRSRN